MIEFAPLIAEKLNIRVKQVETVLSLLAEGATIPFIARYRKDKPVSGPSGYPADPG